MGHDSYATAINVSESERVIDNDSLGGVNVDWGGAIEEVYFNVTLTNTNPTHASSFSLDTSKLVTMGTFTYVPETNGEGIDAFTYSHSVGDYQYEEQGSPPCEAGDACIDVHGTTSNTGNVSIQVGKAVRADIDIDLPEFDPDAMQTTSSWHTYDPAADAGDDKLAIIKLNDDDDNGNNQEDRFELSNSGEHGLTQELVKARLGYWLRDDAEIDDFTAKLKVSTPSTLGRDQIRIWDSPSKSIEYFPYLSGFPFLDGTEFKLADLPAEVWIEGVEKSSVTLTLDITGPTTALFADRTEPPFGPFASTSDSDAVQLGVGVGLTAYRPMHTPGGYDPFQKTAVAESDEIDTKLGPGIRINGDDDDGTGIADRLECSTNTQENDLIEVVIEAVPGQNNLVLEVTHSGLFVWENWSKGSAPIATSSGPSAPLAFDANGQKTVYVEWRDAAHGTGDLTLVNADSNQVLDTNTFHTFQSIVVGFSGETFGSGFGINLPYLQQPVYNIAVDFYESGYDSFYYDVNTHSLGAGGGFTGPAYGEVSNAVWNRKVERVAIYGWSHGGGATALLANTLELGKGQGVLPNTFEIAATAYIDAVRFDGLQTGNFFPENRRPLQDLGITKPHANWYQTNFDPFHGASVPGSDIDLDMTQAAAALGGQDHVSIVILVWNQKLLVNFFDDKIPAR